MAVEHFGVWSVVPPLIAIVLAIITRKAILSLFLGVYSGGIIFTFEDSSEWIAGHLESLGVPDTATGLDVLPGIDPDPTILDVVAWLIAIPIAGLWGFVQAFAWIADSIADIYHAQILIFTLLLGSGVAMIWRLGGSNAIRDWALERLSTQRQGGVVAFILGLVLFFDDYANTAIVGSAMKDVTAKLRISKEKFSYIVDSTAAPVATIAISSWVAFQMSLIADAQEEIADIDPDTAPSAFSVFVESIPFNMYAILAIVMVGIIVVTRRDYGEMLTAEHRSWQTGKISRIEATPMQDIEGDLGDPTVEDPKLMAFLGPIIALVAGVIAAVFWSGYRAEDSEGITDLFGIVTEADYFLALIIGSFTMVLAGFYLGYRYGIHDLGESVDTAIDGFGIMLTAVTILVLAWSIGSVVGDLGTGEYVGEFADDFLMYELLPPVVLILSAFIAFSTGTSWGTMAIMTPIALPIAWGVAPSHTYMAVAVGGIFSGAIFGDHSSPISDTSVLSSTFTGADLIDHVRTQLYYAVTVGLVAIALLIVWGFGAEHLWGESILAAIGLLVVGAAILVGLVYVLSEYDARRKEVEPIAIRADQTVPMEVDLDDD